MEKPYLTKRGWGVGGSAVKNRIQCVATPSRPRPPALSIAPRRATGPCLIMDYAPTIWPQSPRDQPLDRAQIRGQADLDDLRQPARSGRGHHRAAGAPRSAYKVYTDTHTHLHAHLHTSLTIAPQSGTVAPQSFQFRVVTGFSKMPVRGNIVNYPGPFSTVAEQLWVFVCCFCGGRTTA